MTTSPQTATQLDTAIDSLLRNEASLAIAGSQEELTVTARLLRDVLPRFHPRFVFEETLAGRIAAGGLKAGAASPVAPSGDGATIVPFPSPRSPVHAPWGALRRRRGLVAGGAIASGVSIAIPLAGAALVVWRRSRSSGGLW